VQPTAQQASEYFHQKCLTCHTEKSCAIPLIIRQRKTPPNDCAGCHMPKRDVMVISHTVLTNHRIVAQAEELFPDAAFRMTTAEDPDLVDLSSDPSKHAVVEPLTRLQAYAQIVLRRPEYRTHYWSLANQLKASHAENLDVLEALADEAVQKHTDDGSRLAVQYLQEAVRRGTNNPVDFEELATLLIALGRETEALDVLPRGMKVAPYDANLYRQYAKLLLNQKQMRAACDVSAEGAQKFPQDDQLRDLMFRCADGHLGRLN
jgi:tetratricopeptide (TPR) repeat protein